MSEIVDGIIFDLGNLNTDIEAIRDMQEASVVYADCPLTGGSVPNIFDWGGSIMLLALVGEITENISADPCDLKLVMDPSIAGGDLDLCAVIDINGFSVGDILYIDGVIANAMVRAQGGVAYPFGFALPLILPRGTIDLNLANSDPTTGVIDWMIRYKPLESGIVVSVPA